MKKHVVLTLFIALILTSCEKEKQPLAENTDLPLLSKVLVDGNLSYEYSYTEANLLFEEKSKFRYARHNYNNQNLLSSSEFYMDLGMASSDSRVVEESLNRAEWVNPENTSKNLTHEYEYNRIGQPARKHFTSLTSSGSEYSEFTIENDKIIRQTMYWDDELTFYTDYEYDDDGNLIKESKFNVLSTGIEELWTTTEYEFDHMHNPYRAFKGLLSPGKFTNPNNITKETYTIHFEVGQGIEKVQIKVNTYEYNDIGYPVKVNGTAEYLYRE